VDTDRQRQLLAYLAGVEYPATKDDLIKCATDAGANEVALDALRALPSERYADLGALRAELAQQGGDGVDEDGNR
jgi:hypothetical protein